MCLKGGMHSNDNQWNNDYTSQDGDHILRERYEDEQQMCALWGPWVGAGDILYWAAAAQLYTFSFKVHRYFMYFSVGMLYFTTTTEDLKKTNE